MMLPSGIATLVWPVLADQMGPIVATSSHVAPESVDRHTSFK
ncbi:hypothetical protein ASZ90_011358 [hydrocarbon metagenome]|uniref:Uncharacterized protein n=1 Tax=hydrocarbon metagenome TaxID=938273 RepID=A0A0W8FDG8_9ZZZZ